MVFFAGKKTRHFLKLAQSCKRGCADFCGRNGTRAYSFPHRNRTPLRAFADKKLKIGIVGVGYAKHTLSEKEKRARVFASNFT